MQEIKILEQLIDPRHSLTPRIAQDFQNRQDIFFHRKTAKDRRLLRKIPDPAPGPLIHWQVRDGLTVKCNLPFVRLTEPHNHIKDRRLPSTVRTKKPDHFTGTHFDGHTFHDFSPAETLLQPTSPQAGCA
ncbi:MAG: hypothetical protein LZF86_130049 [Nitrospira sp.]|nr:MAG: hypothetical protein LZF86_130049 [Nitrospira sp.]